MLITAGGEGWGGLQCSQWEREGRMYCTVAEQTSRPEEESYKAADLLWEMRKMAVKVIGHSGTGWDGSAVQSATQVGCEMSGLSFGHRWQHPPRPLWRQKRGSKKAESLETASGQEALWSFKKKKKRMCSSFEETFFLLCWGSMRVWFL